MRIFIALILFSFTFSCVSSYRTSNIQYLTPVKAKNNQDKIYQWDKQGTYFKLILQIDSSFNLNLSSIYDCTFSSYLDSSGKYQLGKDSILLHFEKTVGGQDVDNLVKVLSDTTIKTSFSKCEIILLGIDLKNEFCN